MWSLTPLLDFNANLTGDFSKIYYVWVQGFNDFTQYLYEVVYNHAVNSKILDWSIALFFFMLFLSFVVAFIF